MCPYPKLLFPHVIVPNYNQMLDFFFFLLLKWEDSSLGNTGEIKCPSQRVWFGEIDPNLKALINCPTSAANRLMLLFLAFTFIKNTWAQNVKK